MTVVVSRYVDDSDLAEQVSKRLLERLIELQRDQAVAQLCLTGGRIATRMYQALADRVPVSHLDPTRLELWWGDERFVATSDPLRNAGPALATLAASFPLDPALTHPMPAADGVADAMGAAATYEKELGDTVFDICLLGMGEDGHVASVFPHHPSFAPTTSSVIGVSDAPKPPSDRISLSLDRINTSAEVWLVVSGADKAAALAQAVVGAETLPAGQVRGRTVTHFFVDRDAARYLPDFDCEF